MTHLALFLSAFFTVFLLGFQQKNVHGEHYLAAIITSVGIGICQIFLWRLVPDANASQIAATLCGGPAGIVMAMWAHPRLMKNAKRMRPKMNFVFLSGEANPLPGMDASDRRFMVVMDDTDTSND